ncbi:hypothetical protein [Lacipirellula sp.]|uniref:hypothetical protein n=1 Tax=Lacipirellula sp. TaxID=2691419 RepID=UPI003D0F6004
MDAITKIGLFGLFVSALLSLLICFVVAIIRKRFTVRMLFVAVTAACVLAAFLTSAREAARRNAIRNIEIERKRYETWRTNMTPLEYQRAMDQLDARAVEWGAGKQP